MYLGRTLLSVLLGAITSPQHGYQKSAAKEEINCRALCDTDAEEPAEGSEPSCSETDISARWAGVWEIRINLACESKERFGV